MSGGIDECVLSFNVASLQGVAVRMRLNATCRTGIRIKIKPPAVFANSELFLGQSLRIDEWMTQKLRQILDVSWLCDEATFEVS